MVLNYRKYQTKQESVLKDTRDYFTQLGDKLRRNEVAMTMFIVAGFAIYFHIVALMVADIIFIFLSLYFFWLLKSNYRLPFKMPMTSKRIDPNQIPPGGSSPTTAAGILYLGNEDRTKEEVWFTNSDARTHILYLGTTGAGKTEGLKSLVTNALGWGSGFIYIDGKADTHLWSSLSALARRFGRDDDLLVLNYMTGNSDAGSTSNTINPFSSGSASYLTNLVVSLMPEGGGDNAMWKDRAVSLMSALMPVLTWQRDFQEKLLGIAQIRDSLIFKAVIKLTRDDDIPDKLRRGLNGYLDTLPGFDHKDFNDDGTESKAGAQKDLSTVYQQHGYLSMQFTKQLQSLADDYGYIFEQPSADIDMKDVVLNRRILVVLIPALEKSADETANLGKIIGALLKGMMGSTLGSTIEGDVGQAIENKPTEAPTPFMAVFDEVGYYTTQGMAVMAAQARSLGFCLVFAAQDMPALEKRVKEEARSITGNCNIKIFGKLEDPTDTKDFFEKTIGEAMVVESSSQEKDKGFMTKGFKDADSASVTSKAKASYGELKGYREGQAIVSFGDTVIKAQIFYSNPTGLKSLRVNKFVVLPQTDPQGKRSSKDVEAVLERFREKGWSAETCRPPVETSTEITAIAKGFAKARKAKTDLVESGITAFINYAFENNLITEEELAKTSNKPPKKEKEDSKDKKPSKDDTSSESDKKKEKPKEKKSESKKSPPSSSTSKKPTDQPLSWAALAKGKTKNKPEEKIHKQDVEPMSWASLAGGKKKNTEKPASSTSTMSYSTKINTTTNPKPNTEKSSKDKDNDGDSDGTTKSWEEILAQSKKKDD